MRLIHISTVIICVVVGLVWIMVLQLRLPYLDQIPVFDADVTTADALMWTRNWWIEGAWNIWFATPYSPLSIETPTLQSRLLYQSWPPGAFLPIYALAKLFGSEPSVPLINWFNVVTHGLIALAIAFTGFHIARLNRIGLVASTIIAAGLSFPVLYPRGLVYIFSQLYCVTTHILVYAAAFILLEAVSYRTKTTEERRLVLLAQLAVIYFAFFVDWLAYTLFAVWFCLRVLGGRWGFIDRWSPRRKLGLLLLPVSAFGIYLLWRFATPGSTARTEGVWVSIRELIWKIAYRMNLTDDHKISGFPEIFAGMHAYYYSPHVPKLIAGTAILSGLLLAAAYRFTTDREERRRIFATASLFILAILPFYAHMLLFYQHTAIHQWAIAKVVFAYALVPFAIFPVSIIICMRILAFKFPSVRVAESGMAVVALAIAVVAFRAAETSGTVFEAPYLMGRINPDTYRMWDDIRKNTVYRDAVFSPVLSADPIRTEVGVGNKLVYVAKDFEAIDRKIAALCGDFNVVIALPPGGDETAFGARKPSQVIDTGHVRLLRYINYPGPARGCP